VTIPLAMPAIAPEIEFTTPGERDVVHFANVGKGVLCRREVFDRSGGPWSWVSESELLGIVCMASEGYRRDLRIANMLDVEDSSADTTATSSALILHCSCYLNSLPKQCPFLRPASPGESIRDVLKPCAYVPMVSSSTRANNDILNQLANQQQIESIAVRMRGRGSAWVSSRINCNGEALRQTGVGLLGEAKYGTCAMCG
jgi:hypothetical protein